MVLDRIFEYFKLISPNGYGAAFCFLEWDLIKKFVVHWLDKGEDQFSCYIDLLILLDQIDYGKKKIRTPDDFVAKIEPLLNGKYIFGIGEILPEEHCEIIRHLYKEKTSPKALKIKRRRDALKVTSMKTVREAVFKKYTRKELTRRLARVFDEVGN